MSKKLAAIVFATTVAGESFIGAIDNVAIVGSDALETIINPVLAACPGAHLAGVTFIGGGSTTGENALLSTSPGGQTIAPMTRFLVNSPAVCARAGATAEAIHLAYEVLTIAEPPGGACNAAVAIGPTRVIEIGNETGACPGCDAENRTYTAVDWRDVLRLVFGGRHHDAPYSNTNRRAGTIDCKSAARKALLNDWTGTGTRLEHAYRPGDLTTALDLFTDALGLPGMPSTSTAGPYPFCNGWSFTQVSPSTTPPPDDTSARLDSGGAPASLRGGEGDFRDFDPVRRPCCPTDQVCRYDRTLGVVLAVVVPSELNGRMATTSEPLYPSGILCTPGASRFQLINETGGAHAIPFCPSGAPYRFNKCWNPVVSPSGDPRCTARTGVTFGQRGKSQDPDEPGSVARDNDSRAWNLVPKVDQHPEQSFDGYYARDKFPIPGNAGNTRAFVGAFYRQHASNPAPGCTELTSARQLSCLVNVAGCGCNLGVTGGLAPHDGATAVPVNGQLATEASVRVGAYPIARKVYLSTLIGFGGPAGVTGGELELAKCLSNPSVVNPVLATTDFVAPADGGKPLCVDFDEQALCGAETNFDGCTDNPNGVPPNN